MKAHNPKTGVMAEMNMVPLIDISLIILIIFMVMSPFLVQSQLGVQLPKSTSGSQESEDNVIKIQLEPSGLISVQGKKIDSAELENELTLRLARSSKKTVLVQADESVPIQKVVKVFDIAKKLGAGKLGIGVLKDGGHK